MAASLAMEFVGKLAILEPLIPWSTQFVCNAQTMNTPKGCRLTKFTKKIVSLVLECRRSLHRRLEAEAGRRDLSSRTETI